MLPRRPHPGPWQSLEARRPRHFTGTIRHRPYERHRRVCTATSGSGQANSLRTTCRHHSQIYMRGICRIREQPFQLSKRHFLGGPIHRFHWFPDVCARPSTRRHLPRARCGNRPVLLQVASAPLQKTLFTLALQTQGQWCIPSNRLLASVKRRTKRRRRCSVRL
jgi:hypothetical protein